MAILDGKAVAKSVRAEVKSRAQSFFSAHGRKPGLHVVLVGEDPASQVYVASKEKMAVKCGIEGQVHRLAADTPQNWWPWPYPSRNAGLRPASLLN